MDKEWYKEAETLFKHVKAIYTPSSKELPKSPEGM
jgi:hypothetical protein